MIVALDDKWDVWKYLPNVVRVRPYAFLSRILNDRVKKAESTEFLIPQSGPVFDLDAHLDIVFHVLRDVHAEYFGGGGGGEKQEVSTTTMTPQNVGSILCDIRSRVLSGVVILFSGIFPRGDSSPHRKDIWIMAEALGAKCSCGELKDDVTHVVGVRATLKMRQGFAKLGVFAVHVNWILESAFRWKRQIESHFRIQNLTPAPLSINSSSSPSLQHQQKRGIDSIQTSSTTLTKRRRLESHVTLDSEGGETSSSSSDLDDDDIADIENGF